MSRTRKVITTALISFAALGLAAAPAVTAATSTVASAPATHYWA